ncbi:MAG: hypothetical protein EOO24_12555, partial [Comamonadaceae bacterium]
MQRPPLLSRRALLGAAALPFLGGCSTPLPLAATPAGDPAAAARLQESAEVHGLAAYRRITDINIAYDGQWRPLIDRIQPAVVDAGYRGSSQERLMPAAGIVAQAYTGPRGAKQVRWQREAAGRRSAVAVWRNGVPDETPDALDAAALVAEGYGLFPLGPLWLVDRRLPMRMAGTERVDGRLCDVVDVWLAPGLGRSALDRVAVCIDRADGITRRVRFTLEGTVNTKGAVAEVDTFEHARHFGVLWPMRS